MRKHFAPLAALCFVAFGGAGCNTMQLEKDGAAASTAIGAAAATDPRVAKFVAKVNSTIAKIQQSSQPPIAQRHRKFPMPLAS